MRRLGCRQFFQHLTQQVGMDDLIPWRRPRVQVGITKKNDTLYGPHLVLDLHRCHFGDDTRIDGGVLLKLNLHHGQRLVRIVGHHQTVGVSLQRLDGEGAEGAGARRGQASQFEEPVGVGLEETIDLLVGFHRAASLCGRPPAPARRGLGKGWPHQIGSLLRRDLQFRKDIGRQAR
jgi:hypothetical protein